MPFRIKFLSELSISKLFNRAKQPSLPTIKEEFSLFRPSGHLPSSLSAQGSNSSLPKLTRKITRLALGHRESYFPLGVKKQSRGTKNDGYSTAKAASFATTAGILVASAYAYPNDGSTSGEILSNGVNDEQTISPEHEQQVNSEQEKRLEELLLEGLDKIKLAKEKDIILVLGPTGAGKSTLLNYLLGCKMKMNKEGKMQVDGAELIEIGHDNNKSYTLHPGVYERGDRVYVDCPGFFDNRSIPDSTWSQLSTQLVVKLAKNVKGIIMVVTESTISEAKGKIFSELCDTLSLLFESPTELAGSLTLVVSQTEKNKHPPSREKMSRDLQKKVKDKQSELERIEIRYGLRQAATKLVNLEALPVFGKNFNKSDDKEKYERLQREIAPLKLLASSTIVVPDLLDQDGKRTAEKDIIAALDRLETIPAKSLKFKRRSNVRNEFDSLLLGLSDKGHELIRRQRELMGSIRESENEVIQINRELTQLKSSDQGSTNLEEAHTQRVIEIVKKRGRILQERGDCSNTGDVLEVCYEDSIQEPRHPLAFLGWTLKKFIYKGRPFVEIETTKCDGSPFVPSGWFDGDGYFEDGTIDKEKGIYSTVYKSAYYHSGDAAIKLHSKRKESDDFKLRMKRYEDDLLSLDNALTIENAQFKLVRNVHEITLTFPDLNLLHPLLHFQNQVVPIKPQAHITLVIPNKRG